MIAFGPVPSRRLGRGLGINHIPPKVCTYSCVYCQVGRTDRLQVRRRPFYGPREIYQAVRDKVDQARAAGEAIDYLTFVPDGEPTLDINLGRAIARLRPATAYIAIPTRPPAEPWVHAPAEEAINQAYQRLAAVLEHVELLVGYEGNAFAATGNMEEDLLSITAVHPLRREAVEQVLDRCGRDWPAVQQLVDQGRLVETEYQGHRFYLRKLS